MLGLYDRTPKREKVKLDGWWTFCTDPEEQGEREDYVSQFPSGRPITVPGCWNTEFGLFGYHGVAWYRRMFECPFAGKALLTLGAVADLARVWLNGQPLGEHEGGHTAFSFVVDTKAGENELVVRVDNRHSDTTLPKDGVDWFPYGGITRSVICEQVGHAYIENVHVRGQVSGEVEAHVWARNLGNIPHGCAA